MSRARAAGLLLGFAADRLVGDPRRFHPVAGFGRVAGWVERRTYRDTRAAGVVHAGLLVGGSVAFGAVVERAAARPAARVLVTAAATWTVLGGRSLEREALAVHGLLAADDLPGARCRLTHLVGRDTAALEAGEVARAVVESVAENTSDAVIAPLVWGAIAGVPGLLGYRAANTLDAMVGHHNVRYERFGWASARFDDLVNLPSSRLGGLLATALGGDPAAALTAWQRDARQHPSPNAGVVESTFAGSLGVRLGGTNTYYGERIEHRAVMGDGRAVAADDVRRAVRLARRVGLVAVATAAAIAGVSRSGRRRAVRPGLR